MAQTLLRQRLQTLRESPCVHGSTALWAMLSPQFKQTNNMYFYAAPAQVVHGVLSRYSYSCFDLTSKKVPKNYKIMRLFTSVICA